MKERNVAAGRVVAAAQGVVPSVGAAGIRAPGSDSQGGDAVSGGDLPRRSLTGLPTAEYFHAVFEGSALGIALVHADGTPLRCNRALERILGYTEDELSGMSFAEFTHPEDVAADVALYEELLAGTRDRYELEKRYIRKDGATVWCRLAVSLVRGAFVHAIATVEDVTAARDARERQVRLFCDLGDRVKELTALREIARMLQDDVVAVPRLLEAVADALPPAFQHPHACGVEVRYGDLRAATARHAPARWRLASTFRTQDGRSGSVEAVYCEDVPSAAEGPFLEEEQRLLDTLADMIQVTLDRRVAQDLLTLAVTAGGVGLFDWDIGSGTIAWPGQPGRQAGLAGLGVIGTISGFLAAVHDEDRPAVQHAMDRAILDPRSGGRYAAEYRIRGVADDWIWLVAGGQVLRHADGRPDRMVGVATDVTARHRLEEQLRESQKMEAIGLLAGGVAHDFNNLLCVVIGYAEMVAHRLPRGSAELTQIREVIRAGESAAALTRQLLAFGRRQVLQLRVVDLHRVVRDVARMLRRLLPAEIEMTYDLAEGEARVHVDAGQIEQVLINVAVNARDAMPRGGRLTISTRLAGRDELPESLDSPRPDGDAFVVLSIQDTGTGMDEPTRRRIFEPFFTSKALGKGTGLGLSTVYGIIQQFRGALAVESAVGAGTTFRFFLATTEAPLSTSAVSADAVAAPHGPLAILVVEDQDSVRELVSETLRAAGHRVVAASSGEQALAVAAAEAGPFDVLVSDIVLPGIDGPTLAQELSRTSRRLGVVYVSGYADAAVADRLPGDHDAVLISKPHTPRELHDAVARAFAARPPGCTDASQEGGIEFRAGAPRP